MRRDIRALLILAFIAGLSIPSLAIGAKEKGTTGAAFLNLTPGARAAAMGGAMGGIADDAMAAHYNPAGLGRLDHIEVAAGREARYVGLNYDYAVISVPVLSWTDRPRPVSEAGSVALSVFSLTASGIERRGVVETDAPTGNFGASNRAFMMSYGRRVSGNISVGGTLKYVDATLDATRGSAFSGDIGMLLVNKDWSIGAGVRNAWGSLTLGSGSDPLPTSAYLGAGYRLTPTWLLAAQVEQPRYDVASMRVGVERVVMVSYGLSFAARAGWRSDHSDAGGLGGTSIGCGIDWKGVNAEFSWSPGSMLADVFQYALRVRF